MKTAIVESLREPNTTKGEGCDGLRTALESRYIPDTAPRVSQLTLDMLWKFACEDGEADPEGISAAYQRLAPSMTRFVV